MSSYQGNKDGANHLKGYEARSKIVKPHKRKQAKSCEKPRSS